MNILPKITIGEIQNMQIEEQLDALSSIWDQIALKNPAIEVSQDDKQLLDERFANEQNSTGTSWTELKKRILNSKK
ncbi:hypothetical protein AB3N61_07825 [Leptospira sp. WS58.C1]|nr:hypothetical protein [Leptospira sp. id769339]MCR1793490.1 hypothetical protein [Leptospira sp. id769339]